MPAMMIVIKRSSMSVILGLRARPIRKTELSIPRPPTFAIARFAPLGHPRLRTLCSLPGPLRPPSVPSRALPIKGLWRPTISSFCKRKSWAQWPYCRPRLTPFRASPFRQAPSGHTSPVTETNPAHARNPPPFRVIAGHLWSLFGKRCDWSGASERSRRLEGRRPEGRVRRRYARAREPRRLGGEVLYSALRLIALRGPKSKLLHGCLMNRRSFRVQVALT
jgi:hypothetical protein